MSPLAGDINWMETAIVGAAKEAAREIASPLAGDINWMETSSILPALVAYTLSSPLAGDINWMETV